MQHFELRNKNSMVQYLFQLPDTCIILLSS